MCTVSPAPLSEAHWLYYSRVHYVVSLDTSIGMFLLLLVVLPSPPVLGEEVLLITGGYNGSNYLSESEVFHPNPCQVTLTTAVHEKESVRGLKEKQKDKAKFLAQLQ